MGLLDRFRNRIRLPAFSVGIFGKLPCHKEYLQVSCHPVFGPLKSSLDSGFDAMIRSGMDRPYVAPNRGFYIKTGDPKTDLAGMIFESDDGLRGFPFMMAAPLPRKLHGRPFAELWQCLERLWQYLAAYHQDLRAQSDGRQVLNRVRDVVHELDAFAPEDWEDEPPTGKTADVLAELQTGPARVPLQDLTAHAERHLVLTLRPRVNPSFILWPEQGWQRHHKDLPVVGLLGKRGLEDMDFSLFPPAVVSDHPPSLTEWRIPGAPADLEDGRESAEEAETELLSEEPTLALPREKPPEPPNPEADTLVLLTQSEESSPDAEEDPSDGSAGSPQDEEKE